ncbi:MAG: M23 family metallopeptidase [Holosporales bacterium]
MRRLVLFFALVLAFPAYALTLNTAPSQGGVAVGRAAPGTQVRLNDTPVPVAEDGVFLLAFAYNAPATAKLSITAPGGEQVEETLSVAKRTWQVQRIDGLPQAKVTPNPEDLARIQHDQARFFEQRSRQTPQPWYRSGFIMPLEGRISGVFASQRILNGEPRQPHFGVDVAAPVGTPFVSPADGVVVIASEDFFLTGGTLMIDHGYGVTSIFAHLNSIDVAVGDKVTQGQHLGTVGNTGRSTGPHLHWGTAVGRIQVDPLELLKLKFTDSQP